MRINIVTIFPGFFTGPLGLSIPGRAAEAALVSYRILDLRDFTHDKHRVVDDKPYGGGSGMVMKPEPLVAAIESLAGPKGPGRDHDDRQGGRGNGRRVRVVLLTPQGTPLTQRKLEELTAEGV